MSDTATVATPTETAPAPSVGLSDLSPTQRETWLKTGDLPSSEPEPSPTPDEAATVTAGAESAPSEKTPVEPTPATKNKPRDDTNARFGQLAEQKRLAVERAEAAERKAAELEAKLAGTASAAPAPVATPTHAESRAEAVKRYQQEAEWPGDINEFAAFDDPYGALLAAQAVYIGERQSAERERLQTQRTERERAQAIVDKTWADLKTHYPDTDPDALKDVKGQSAGILSQLLFESPISVELLNYFSNHPAEARTVAAMEPLAAAHALGKLESRLSTPAPSRIAAPTKTVSSAPEPIQTLGSRHTPNAGDELEQAIRDKDTGRYIELANQRELAQIKAGRR